MRLSFPIRMKLSAGKKLSALVVAGMLVCAMPTVHAQGFVQVSAYVPSVVDLTEGGQYVAEQFLLTAANQERAALGIQPLRLDASLSHASALHAAQMADHEDISHQFTGEPNLEDRGANAGVRFSMIAENVGEAPTSIIIHNLWMNSPAHRANLLDPEVNTVGIAVIERDGEFYAVEDFANTVEPLTFAEQENTVARTLVRAGVPVADGTADARMTCAMQSGYVGARPASILRYTVSTLTDLPALLKARAGSGKYRQALVGACADTRKTAFTAYNIAVLLYP